MPLRKQNRLAGYDYSQPGAYFVTVCTRERSQILGSIVGPIDPIGPSATPSVGADTLIGPSAAPHVGADALIGPSATPHVGADALIGPSTQPHVGADALIGPSAAPHIRLTNVGLIVEKYLKRIPGLGQYVIMPNHVHMILHISAEHPLEGPMWASAPTNASIPSLVRTWKGLVSKELGRSIWQRSYYDHIIRDEREYIEIAEYILHNPAKWCEDRYYPGY